MRKFLAYSVFIVIGLVLAVAVIKYPWTSALRPSELIGKAQSLLLEFLQKGKSSKVNSQPSGFLDSKNDVPKKTNPPVKVDPRMSELNQRLSFAIGQGDIDGITQALKAGADANCCADYGVGTPLMQAAFRKHIDSVRLLLDSGADVNRQSTQDGQTVLHKVVFFCITGDRLPLAELLLERGADVTIKDKSGMAPLDYAFRNDCRAIQDRMVAHAERQGKTSAIAEAKSRKPDAQTSLNLRLCQAASRGDLQGIKTALKAGANINCSEFGGRTPLIEAAFTKQVEAVQLLLDLGADVNSQSHGGWTALRYVGQHCCQPDDQESKQRALKAAELLLQRGADLCVLNDNGDPAWAAPYLMPAMCKRYCRSMRMLFLQYSEQREPLTISSGRCSREGMNRHFLDIMYDGYLYPSIVPSIHAPKHPDLDEIKAVIAAGGDENCCRDWVRGAPIMEAAELRSLDAAQLLIELGADVNGQSSKDGETAMHRLMNGCAAWGVATRQEKDDAMARLLLDNGADLTIKDLKGNTAVDKAFERHCDKFQPLLLAYRDKGSPPDPSQTTLARPTGGTSRSAEAQRGMNWKLAHAAADGKTTEMQDAIRGGGDVNCCVNEGDGTPLMRAAFRNQLEAVRFLLDSGADVNLQATSDGRTALHTVVKGYSPYTSGGKQKLVIAKLLLERGADSNIQDRTGKSPLDILTQPDQKTMKQLLLQYR